VKEKLIRYPDYWSLRGRRKHSTVYQGILKKEKVKSRKDSDYDLCVVAGNLTKYQPSRFL
jgi:hypothetical protein